MKWRTNLLLSCSKFAIVLGDILLNQTLAAPFNVVGKALHITSSRVMCRCIKVLKDSMWSKGSFESSYDSSCGRRNFGGRGRFNTLVVNSESVLRIIPSRFSTAFPFVALLSSSISLLMLWSSLSILDEFFLRLLSFYDHHCCSYAFLHFFDHFRLWWFALALNFVVLVHRHLLSMLEFAVLLEWNPSGIKRISFVKKGNFYGFANVSQDGSKLMMQKIINMNSSSIQIDKGVGFV